MNAENLLLKFFLINSSIYKVKFNRKQSSEIMLFWVSLYQKMFFLWLYFEILHVLEH